MAKSYNPHDVRAHQITWDDVRNAAPRRRARWPLALVGGLLLVSVGTCLYIADIAGKPQRIPSVEPVAVEGEKKRGSSLPNPYQELCKMLSRLDANTRVDAGHCPPVSR